VASGAGEGERLWFVGTLATIRVSGEEVGGRYSITEFLLPHHASPPLHTHPQDETVLLLQGQMTFQVEEERFMLEEGGIAPVPMGVAHTFRVESGTARMLALSTPAGLEQLFRDAGVPATEPTLPPPDTPRPSPEEMAEIFERNGQRSLGPPIGPDD
jgi:quercetin dioxygenase-like cupin family protein